MDKNQCDINWFMVGAKCLGPDGGYESFLKKLLEYHKNNNIKYYVACKANGDGMMNPDTLDGAVQAIYYEMRERLRV